MKLHMLFAPHKPWRKKPANYDAKHAQLRAECAVPDAPAKSGKPLRKWARSELHRLAGEV